jgi:hypothetical protein
MIHQPDQNIKESQPQPLTFVETPIFIDSLQKIAFIKLRGCLKSGNLLRGQFLTGAAHAQLRGRLELINIQPEAFGARERNAVFLDRNKVF